MKRKLLCLLLALFAVAALLPALLLPVAGEEQEDTLPGYVTDGLVLWFDAYDNTADNTNLDLAAGTWKSKVGDRTATLVSGTFAWEARQGGGIGWTQDAAVSTAVQPNAIVLDPAWIPEGSYTVELFAVQDGITQNGERYMDKQDESGHPYGIAAGESFAVGAFRSYTFLCLHEKSGGAASANQLGYRWYYTGMLYSDHFGSFKDRVGVSLGTESIIRQVPVGTPLLLSLSNDRTEKQAALCVRYNGLAALSAAVTPEDLHTKDGEMIPNNAAYDGKGVQKDSNARFCLMGGMAGTVYAVRVYDRALDAAESAQNTLADLCRVYRPDLAGYNALSATEKKQVLLTLSSTGFGEGKAGLEKGLAAAVLRLREEQAKEEDWKKDLAGRQDNYDRYYVQDGLTVFLDAFAALPEYNDTFQLAAGIWRSKVGDAVATLGGGDDYWRSFGRGIGYTLTREEYRASLVNGVSRPGVFLDAALLPTGDFTIETVWNPQGLTNADGTPYTDPATSPDTYGIFTGDYSAFSFGMFKGMAFLCRSETAHGKNNGMSIRWCYTAKEWGQHNGTAGYTQDYALRNGSTANPGLYPVSYVFQLRRGTGLHTFTTYYETQKAATMLVQPLHEGTEKKFELMHGYAGVVYAIRVYDRVLSAAERSQNHMADLLNYYGLDTALLDLVMGCLPEHDSLYALFDDMDFSLSREEAQTAFDNRIGGAWVTALGVSASLEGAGGLRGEFTLDETALANMEALGYRATLRLLLGRDGKVPTLEDAAFSATVREADGTVAASYVLSEKDGLLRVALAVLYRNPTPEMCAEQLRFAAALTLTAPDGKELVFYARAREGEENSYCEVYTTLFREEYTTNRMVRDAVGRSYDKKTVLVDAASGSDTADGITVPVKTLKRALELAVALRGTVPLEVTVKLADGTYYVEDTIETEGLPYFRLHLCGESADGVVITSEKQVEAAFTKVDGKPYYMARLSPDADGSYPDFRVLYVNGEMATLAHEGYTRSSAAEAAGAERLRHRYELFKEADGKTDAPCKLYLPLSLFEGLTEEDFRKLEWHSPVSWYYRSMHIDRIDRADTTADNWVAVYFRKDEAAQWTAQHGVKYFYFWLENALPFVDEGGEYFYDETSGTLYYCPRDGEDMADAVVTYPTAEYLLAFSDVEGLTLENLTFTGTDNRVFDKGGYFGGQASTADGVYGENTLAAVYLRNPVDVTISGCIFRNLAGSGIKVAEDARYVTVSGCTFRQIGSSAVDFCNRMSERGDGNFMERIVITENVMQDLAVLTRGSVGVLVGQVKDLEISSNTICGTSYSAISVGWRWTSVDFEVGEQVQLYGVEITSNFISSFMTDQCDGGAIYTLGANARQDYTDYFNTVSGNFVYADENTWDGQAKIMPYYHDGSSSNWYTAGNILLLTPSRPVRAAFFLQSLKGQETHNILVADNYVIGVCQTAQQRKDGYRLSTEEEEIFLFERDANGQKDAMGLYPSRVDAARGLEQSGNTIFEHPDEVDDLALTIIASSGAPSAPAEADALLAKAAAAYHAYYAQAKD